LTHSVHVDVEDPLRLFFYEEWADRAALDVHFAQDGSAAFMRAVRELCASSTRVRILPVADRT
ncbi:MAG TPA: antibiotic biosynthesis monooxygenase, partial [Phenylobacterium sp.]|nr:antibiotic biosynthesis monooxygenase [Phenylobacterium sp.]